MQVHRLIVLIAATSATAWCGQFPSTTAASVPGSIRWRVEKAKEQGESSIIVQSPIGMFEKIDSLDQALSTYHVVIATPVASATQVLDYCINTWYKLKTLERLVPHPNPEVAAVPIYEALLPVRADEIAIFVPQGTITIDGVRVTAGGPDSRLLTLHKKYLFFLSPDKSGNFAWLRVGPDAIFRIKPDNTIAALIDTESPLQIDLETSTGKSLDSLRRIAKAKVAELFQQ